MNNKNGGWLYLISSNATKEYIIDILEVLSLPNGSVQHFRYQLRWLDEKLRNLLPIKGQKQASKLKNRKVVICYLYQEKQNSTWNWIAVYPIRSGTLIASYKTGSGDSDIAHFYFRVEKYVSYNCNQDFTEIIKDKINENFNKAYASLGYGFDMHLSNKEESKSAFHKICESFDFKHLKSPEGNGYFPLYCFIDGLKYKKGKLLVPKYDPLTYKSFYEINEGELYSFEFSTYFTKELKKLPQYDINLLSDEKIFSTPPEYKLKASSRYDEESWAIVSSLLERDTWTSISFKTELPHKVDGKESLNIHLNFPIKVKRKILYRIIDALSDIGFGIGTGAMALKAAFPPSEMTWWYWPAILGYASWAICKLIIKFWRG